MASANPVQTSQAVENIFNQPSYNLGDVLEFVAIASGRDKTQLTSINVSGSVAREIVMGLSVGGDGSANSGAKRGSRKSTEAIAPASAPTATTEESGGDTSLVATADLKAARDQGQRRTATAILKEFDLPNRNITKVRELLPRNRVESTINEALKLIDPSGDRHRDILGAISDMNEAGQVYVEAFAKPYRDKPNFNTYPTKIQKAANKMLGDLGASSGGDDGGGQESESVAATAQA